MEEYPQIFELTEETQSELSEKDTANNGRYSESNSVTAEEILNNLFKFNPNVHDLKSYVDKCIYIRGFEYLGTSKFRKEKSTPTYKIFFILDGEDLWIKTGAEYIVAALDNLKEFTNQSKPNFFEVVLNGEPTTVAVIVRQKKVGGHTGAFYFESPKEK